MAHQELSENIFNCKICHTRCDGKSKKKYLFENDVEFAEQYENLIIEKINAKSSFTAIKSVAPGFPDIEIISENGKIYRYLEVKAQRRTFISVETKLSASKLYPSETVALNLSDLLRYFKIEEETGIPTSIVWVLLNRPCIVPEGSEKFYYQKTTELKKIYFSNKLSRKFKRKSGEGDMVEGQHKGVVTNYHFSINELVEWKI